MILIRVCVYNVWSSCSFVLVSATAGSSRSKPLWRSKNSTSSVSVTVLPYTCTNYITAISLRWLQNWLKGSRHKPQILVKNYENVKQTSAIKWMWLVITKYGKSENNSYCSHAVWFNCTDVHDIVPIPALYVVAHKYTSWNCFWIPYRTNQQQSNIGKKGKPPLGGSAHELLLSCSCPARLVGC